MKRVQLNAVIDAVALVGFMVLASTGLVLRFQLPPGAGGMLGRGRGRGSLQQPLDLLWGLTRHEWGDYHYWIALGLLAVLSLHLFLHWKWIVGVVRGKTSESSGWRFALGLFAFAAVTLAVAMPMLSSTSTITRKNFSNSGRINPLQIPRPVRIFNSQERQAVMNRQILVGTLGNLRFLKGVAKTHLEELAGIARLEEYDEGDVLFAEGEPVDDVYLVIEGEVALEVSSSGVCPQLLLSLAAGESIGWSALMHRTHRTATAKVTAPTRVFRIDGMRLLALCEEHPRFGYQVMRATVAALASRLHAMQLRFFDIYRLQPGGFTCGVVEIGVD